MLRKTIQTFISFLIAILLINSLNAQALEKTCHTNKAHEPSQVRIKEEYEGGKQQLFKIYLLTLNTQQKHYKTIYE